MPDLQLFELAGSTKETLWQLFQLVVLEISGEGRDRKGV